MNHLLQRTPALRRPTKTLPASIGGFVRAAGMS